jgi:hypothetical protein
MRVIEATFKRKPIGGRKGASSVPERQECARHSCLTWGNFATLVVGCTIVATALFLGSRAP